jgi:hypothetical protein
MQHPQHLEPQETQSTKKAPRHSPKSAQKHPNPTKIQTQKYKKARITSEKQTQNTNQTPNTKEKEKTKVGGA